jgi:hypothetical protein
MKIIKWIGHPVVVIVLYLLLIIEGDEFGGFFMLYLLLSIPHLVPYALMAAAGLSLMVIAFNYKDQKMTSLISYLIGYTMMLTSLAIFFSKGNKWKTFEPGLPLFSFILFGISSLCFVIWIFSLCQRLVSSTVSKADLK